MALTHFYEVHGHRYPAEAVTSIFERRCDDCGEFVAEGVGVSGHITVTVVGQSVKAAQYDAHPEHAGQALAKLIETLTAKLA